MPWMSQLSSAPFNAFIALADKKREVTDKDIESLLAEDKRVVADTYHLDRIQVTCGDRGIPTAAVRLIAPTARSSPMRPSALAPWMLSVK